MKIIIDTPEGIAKQAAAIYKEILDAKPNAVLGFATGSTPLDLYAELVRLYEAGEISFKDVTTFNLDEYVGLEPTHDQSYRYFMDTNLFNKIDVDPANTHVPSGLDTSDEALAAYDAAIEAAGGEDLHILGIGVNGHIAFNKPGDPIDTMTHVVELTQNTREVNARFFESIDDVPMLSRSARSFSSRYRNASAASGVRGRFPSAISHKALARGTNSRSRPDIRYSDRRMGLLRRDEASPEGIRSSVVTAPG